jgi:hypothetical protein
MENEPAGKVWDAPAIVQDLTRVTPASTSMAVLARLRGSP